MSGKFHGDVRPLSHDKRYMGKPFHGTLKNAVRQAKSRTNFGLSQISQRSWIAGYLMNGNKRPSRDRIALLQHHNLVPL